MFFEPVKAGATPSEIEVAMLKLPLKLAAGLNVTPESRAFTLASAPLADHTPVAALYVEVTPPDVAVERLPASGFDKVSVAAVMAPLSTSLTAMSVRLSGVSSA